jgi:hypothetical protein
MSQRLPAQRVGWILPPEAVKDRGTQCPNRCGWNRVQSTRFGKPNQSESQLLFHFAQPAFALPKSADFAAYFY